MLLIRPHPQTTDTLPSYLLRLTAANGYKNPMQLLRSNQFQLLNNRLPGKKIFFGDFDLKAMADLANINVNELLALQFNRTSSTKFSFAGNEYKLKHMLFSAIKVCPECYKNNGVIAFENIFKAKTFCTIHRQPLITKHPLTNKNLSWGSHYLWRDIPSRKNMNKSKSISNHEFQMNKNIELLANNQRSQLPKPFNTLSLSDYLDVLAFFTNFHLPTFGVVAEPYVISYRYLTAWPTIFFTLLSKYENEPMSDKRLTGVRKYFRDLYDELYSKENMNSTEFKILRTSFEGYLCKHFKHGSINNSFEWLNTETKNLTSLLNEKQSYELLNCPRSRLKLFIREKLIVVTQVIENGIQLFQRNELLAFKDRIGKCLTLIECAKQLDISEYLTRKLVYSGIIKPLLIPNDRNRDWLIEISAIEFFIVKLSKNSISLKNTETKSFKRLAFAGYDICELLFSMTAGDLKYDFNKNSKKPLSLLQFKPYFDTTDLPSIDNVTPFEASKSLNININAVYAFIKIGLLQCKKVKVNRTPRPVIVITQKSILYFKTHFLLTKQLSGKDKDLYILISGPSVDGGVVNVYAKVSYSEKHFMYEHA
jgi:hypothetical protein